MKIDGKVVADLLTGSRVVAAAVVLAAAFVGTPDDHLRWVAVLVIGAWTTDLFDGWLARRSGRANEGGIGRYDLPIDATLATATLIFLARLGWLPPLALLGYVALITVIWLVWRSHWVWNGFNTGSHLIALGSLLHLLPGLGQIVLAWGALMLAIGRNRLRQMWAEFRHARAHP